jgi:hypothetical protein
VGALPFRGNRGHVTNERDDDLAQLDPVSMPGMPVSLVHALTEWVEGPASVEELARPT